MTDEIPVVHDEKSLQKKLGNVAHEKVDLGFYDCICEKRDETIQEKAKETGCVVILHTEDDEIYDQYWGYRPASQTTPSQ